MSRIKHHSTIVLIHHFSEWCLKEITPLTNPVNNTGWTTPCCWIWSYIRSKYIFPNRPTQKGKAKTPQRKLDEKCESPNPMFKMYISWVFIWNSSAICLYTWYFTIYQWTYTANATALHFKATLKPWSQILASFIELSLNQQWIGLCPLLGVKSFPEIMSNKMFAVIWR